MLPVMATEPQPVVARPGLQDGEARFWKLVFASHYAVVLQWRLGRVGKLTPNRLAQRRLFVPLTAQRWGEILDAACGPA
jgi:hypothetical protein